MNRDHLPLASAASRARRGSQLLTGLLLLGSAMAHAQPQPTAAQPATAQPATSQPTAPPEPASQPAAHAATAAAHAATAAAHAATAAGDQQLRLELQQVKQQVQTLTELLAATQQSAAAETSKPQDRIRLYGFLDTTFHKVFPKEGSLYDGLFYNSSTFLMNRINVYLASQMTETLSALIELRFTYLPVGNVKSLGAPLVGAPFQRADGLAKDLYSGVDEQLNGLMIERAHVTYQPYDFFGVLAGRFLTPYGIWNVDHGSPVLIPARQPTMVLRRYVPIAQTGIQLFGRVFPWKNTMLDYSLSVSNGRGPIESSMDLDENKGIGLRLRLTYERPGFSFAVGGYGYNGDYTDSEINVVAFSPFDAEIEETTKFNEWIGAADVQIKLWGLLLQAEHASSRVIYDIRGPLRTDGGMPGVLAPDHVKSAGYALAAYQLPLERLIGQRPLRPYFMLEWEDEVNGTNSSGKTYTAGLNFQPSPWITLKGEYFFVTTHTPGQADGDFWGLTAQAAVAF